MGGRKAGGLNVKAPLNNDKQYYVQLIDNKKMFSSHPTVEKNAYI